MKWNRYGDEERRQFKITEGGASMQAGGTTKGPMKRISPTNQH